jgi:hypothetical protein
MHFSHAAPRQKVLRLLQNTWVTRNIAVTQSVYRERGRASFALLFSYARNGTGGAGVPVNGITTSESKSFLSKLQKSVDK